VELQYTIEILHQQEQRQAPPFEQLHHQNNPNSPLPPLPHIQIPHPQYSPPPMYEIHQQPPPQYGTTDPKSPLADHMQLAPWPSQYQATPPPKYHGNTDPYKFHEVVIASAGRDEATLTKLLIISMEDAATNWYSRIPPKCIYSW
jgi:hypothetical protein